MQLPVSLAREDTLNTCSATVPCSQGGVSVCIYDAPAALASLPREGTMLVRFRRDEASVNTRGEEPRIRLELTLTEILEVTAESREADEDDKESMLDRLFAEAKEDEPSESDE